VRRVIEVVDGHCQTESYIYRLQADESRESADLFGVARSTVYRAIQRDARQREDRPTPLHQQRIGWWERAAH
jgi:predicted DNA-binding transcriptional regulator AlpA